jgi:uncharacterized membrane protein
MSDGQGTMARLERTVGFVLRLGVTASSACLAGGLMLGLTNVGPAPSRILLQTGVLVLLATPIARVVVTIWEYFVERDWMFVTLTTVVFLELAASVVAALAFKQRL